MSQPLENDNLSTGNFSLSDASALITRAERVEAWLQLEREGLTLEAARLIVKALKVSDQVEITLKTKHGCIITVAPMQEWFVPGSRQRNNRPK